MENSTTHEIAYYEGFITVNGVTAEPTGQYFEVRGGGVEAKK